MYLIITLFPGVIYYFERKSHWHPIL